MPVPLGQYKTDGTSTKSPGNLLGVGYYLNVIGIKVSLFTGTYIVMSVLVAVPDSIYLPFI